MNTEIKLLSEDEIENEAIKFAGSNDDKGVGFYAGIEFASSYWKQRCLEEVGKAWDNSHKRSFWLKQRISLQRGVEPSSKEEYIEQLKKTL